MPEVIPGVGWIQVHGLERGDRSRVDLAVILTAHNGVNYGQLAEWVSIVVDTRNTMDGVQCGTAKIWKA